MPTFEQRVRTIFWTAIYGGRIKRGTTCEKCGVTPRDQSLIHGHHGDYGKPYEVRWLCASCHKRHHVALKKAQVA